MAGRRVRTVVAEELLRAELEDENRGTEFEESDDELDAVELTPEDLYEDNAPDESEEEQETTSGIAEVAEKAIAKSGGVYVIYRGMRDGSRSPVAITVTVPNDRTKPDDGSAIITQGETYVMRPDKPLQVTQKEARWLCSHPVYEIEKQS